ncbi:MAG: hypothetical protein CM15mP71_5710 [Candidatus Poseidoniales archaeon]|nr:MAG: hypothetical protein CM15mP71_5710 [Candidatus Poseidoniales archaeon]
MEKIRKSTVFVKRESTGTIYLNKSVNTWNMSQLTMIGFGVGKQSMTQQLIAKSTIGAVPRTNRI